jgi:Tfp pilus assembly protein PilV
MWITVLFFNSRNDLEKGASCLHVNLLKNGLTMHIGTRATPSKTEAMYFLLPKRLYSDADTSRLGVLNYIGNPVGFIDLRRNSNTLVQSSSILWTQMQTLISELSRQRPPLGLIKTFWLTKPLISKSKETYRLRFAEHSSLRQRNSMLMGWSVQLPSSFPSLARSNHVPHYRRSNNSPPYSSASLFKHLSIEPFDTY